MTFLKIYHNRLTNLTISRIIFFKCTLQFHGTHVTRYINFKLLYKFRIVAFFFKYKYNAYIIETRILRQSFKYLSFLLIF